MPCNKDCNQGRNCDCPRTGDRVVVVVTALLLIAIGAMGFALYKITHGNEGEECQIEVQFKEGIKATYIGTII